jgi:hypothetical protein
MTTLAQVARITYCVELTIKQFIYLTDRDDRENLAGRSCDLDSILSGLTYAHSLEFNGHFGAAVFFALDEEDKADAEVVAKLIKMYANKRTYSDIFEASLSSSYSHIKNTHHISGFESFVGRYK